MSGLGQAITFETAVGIAFDDEKLIPATASILNQAGHRPLIFERRDVASGHWPAVRCRAVVASPEALRRHQCVSQPSLRRPVILALARHSMMKDRFSISAASSFVLSDENLSRLPSLVALSPFRLCMMPKEIISRQVGLSPQLLHLGRLSAEDREVLVELGRGGTNQSIATHLGISVAKTKGRIRRIIRRLGLRNRTDAAIFAATIAAIR